MQIDAPYRSEPVDDPRLLATLSKNGARLRKLAPGANRLFAEFNERYFGGRLRDVTVRYSIRNATRALATSRRRLRGTYCMGVITLSALLEQEQMPRTLIHEMIHAAGFHDHDEAFAAEARRIRTLGAPVSDRDCVTRKRT